MKRTATDSDCGKTTLRRSTRVKMMAALDKRTTRRPPNTKKQKLRAEKLMTTPLLRALPMVLCRSGFLYKHECLNAAATCHDWSDIWEEDQHQLPDASNVEIQVSLDGGADTWPAWVQLRDLQGIIPSQEFVKTIFTKVNDLKVAAKRSRNEQLEARAELPKWGVDFHVVYIHVWGPNKYNSGGIHMSLYKHGSPIRNSSVRVKGWAIRLDTDLVLWTGIRAWRVYDFEPLWKCPRVLLHTLRVYTLHYFDGLEYMSVSDEFEEEVYAEEDG